MKILHVIPSYEPAWAFGGTVTATANLCRALASKGVDVTVYTTNADGKGGQLDVPLNAEVNVGGVKVYYFRSSLGRSGNFYSRTLSKKILATVRDFDVVHVSAVWQWMQVDVARFCCNFKVPYLISLHGSLNPWTLTQKTLKKKIYWNLFGKQTFRYASAIHYTCAEERRLTVPIIGKLRNVPGFVVPNGVNSQVNGLNIREKMGIGLDKFVLLYAGRIHRQKGLDFVIKAMSRQGLEKLVLLLVGYSDDLAYAGYLKRISAGIQNRIIWVNPVTAAGISDYYSSSNLFVLPSYGENFSMVAVEAMSFGLPVLITKNVGIWREVEQDKAGFIVEQNSEEISVLLGKVSQDRDLLRTISAHARACAETRYDINNVAALMAKAYEDIISGTQTKELQWE